MRHSLSLCVLPLILISSIGSLAGCASVAVTDPAGYGAPPQASSAAAQIQNYVASHWADRKPENLATGAAQKAHHEQLGMTGASVDWQGYGVPVTLDINAKNGRRVEGRKYAAMFTGGQLVDLVDYAGQTNSQHTRAFYWDDGRAAAPQATEQVAPPVKPVPVVTTPGPVKSVEGPATIATAPVARAEWESLAGTPKIGTKVYLATDKSYIGVVLAYEAAHAFGSGLVTPSIQVRYLSGVADWFPVTVATQIYAVRAGK